MITKLFRKKAMVLLLLGSALVIAAVACGSDPDRAPASGDNDRNGGSEVPTVPASDQNPSGYAAVKAAIEANGGVVAESGQEPSGIFSHTYTTVLVNGETVQVYEFDSASAASAAAVTVSSDGTTITSGDTPPIAIDFLNQPHYFQQGEVIVVYTGDDDAVVSLLRDTLGEEFAGDRSPVDPDKTDSPGYETVLEPAPIDSVKLIEDADNPGHFLLQVTSGLPSGCATFHDWSVVQTGELELTLTMLNRVPAPGELVACTAIYGFAEHTISLGSAQDNLDVCEVYTVHWQNYGEDESLRFQATAPNVRCADPGLPLGPVDPDGPAVSPIISDLDALILGLRAAGIDVEVSEEKGSKLFGVVSTILTVGGERVELFSFAPGSDALRAAAGVSIDGYTFSSLDDPLTEMQVSWISTPHFYLNGNSIVLYVGVNEEIIAALDRSTGQKFAGPGAEPLELPDGGEDRPFPLPLPPDVDTALVPAPIVKVGDVFVAESFPVQYFIEVVSAQPTGCDRDAGWEVEIDGNQVFIDVMNSQPADLSVVLCAAVYGETSHNIRFGTGDQFESGVEYTIVVNGKVSGTFIAQ